MTVDPAPGGAELPDRARAVIIGAGIMGSALAHHLALQGWTDLVLLDQGPFPNPGGSTGHSSAQNWLPEANRLLTSASVDTVAQFRELGVCRTVGGLDLARTPERLADFRRRLGFIRTWGEFEGEIVSPARVKQLVPYLDESILVGALYLPQTVVVDAVRAGTLMREAATNAGALEAFPLTEVTGLDVDAGRIAAVRTSRGRIETSTVVICCGVWSSRIARMAGASIPFHPAVSQLVSVGPIAAFADLPGEISFPVIRDSDPRFYARRVGADMELGYAGHRPILVNPEEIPSLEDATLTPTELPFTPDDFDPALEAALELFPSLFDDERAGIRYSINGLVSLCADGLPIVGRQPEVEGLWSANRIDIKMAPAIARILAGWIVNGIPQTAMSPYDLARFLPHERTSAHVRARAAEWWSRNYEMVHPGREPTSSRGARLTPVQDRLVGLGAVFGDQAGWEVPKWYTANEPLVAHYGERVLPRTHEWDARWWSPIVNAEHLAMRERGGIEDLSAQAVFEVSGPGTLAWLDWLAVAHVPSEAGRTVRTWLLDPAGNVVGEVLVLGLQPDRWLVLSAATAEARDWQWLARQLPADGSVGLRNATGERAWLGVWGARAGALVADITGLETSDDAFPAGALRAASLPTRSGDGPTDVVVARTDRLGGPGWELGVSRDAAAGAWDVLQGAGASDGFVAIGSGVSGTTARLEAGLRSRSLDFLGGFNLVEAGLADTVKASDFVGREALERQLAAGPAALLCTLAVVDHRSPAGERRFMLGGEPVLDREGRLLVDPRGRRSFVTSAGSAPSLGRHLLTAYLPVDRARIGESLLIEYFGDHYPVSVVAVGGRSAVTAAGLPESGPSTAT